MFRFKLIALMALVPFVLGLAAVGDAVAGESGKVVNEGVRHNYYYYVKFLLTQETE